MILRESDRDNQPKVTTMTNVSDAIIPTPEDQSIAFNLNEWRKNLKMGDVAFFCSFNTRVFASVVILKWKDGVDILGNPTDHARIFRDGGMLYVHRSYLYPTMPDTIPEHWLFG